MKILYSHMPTNYITCGLYAAIQTINPDSILFNPEVVNINDAIYEQKPNLIFIHSEYIQNNTIPTLLQANIPYGIFINNTLTTNTNKKIELKPAANIVQYNNGKKIPKFTSDVLYISNQQLSQKLFEVLDLLDNSDLRVKMVGLVALPFMSYIGNASVQDIADLMMSTKCMLDNYEDAKAYGIPCIAHEDVNDKSNIISASLIKVKPNKSNNYLNTARDIFHLFDIIEFDNHINEILEKLL